MSTLRPLPPRPSLEFEHKEAKAMLRLLRAGDANALTRARAQHPAINTSDPGRINLADAQLVIAREYGFTSWPRLVRYFSDLERQYYPHRGLAHKPDIYGSNVKWLMAEHRQRRVNVARLIAAYVPRLYGASLEEVFLATVTEDEARLAIARMNGFPSWELLMQRVAEDNTRPWDDEWEFNPFDPARTAIEAGDIEELKRLVDEYPELLEVKDDGEQRRPSLLGAALVFERRKGVEALRPIMEWLSAQGCDVQGALNDELCGPMGGMDAERLQYLLDRGADPNWVTAGGIPVLEHALIKYENPAAVDLLARHVVPRSALWIAAGLGDVVGVSKFLDRDGKPTAAARRIRPDFAAMRFPWPQHPDADDEEILLEGFLVAMLNERTEVLDYMITRGTPVNSLTYGIPLVNFAVGNFMVPAVESLVQGGADLDIKGRHPDMTARELAREIFDDDPEDPVRRRIAELCGLDPDSVLAAREIRPLPTPVIHPHFERALELANDDAARLGQSEVCAENLLFGILRNRKGGLNVFMRLSEMDLDRFRADVNDRMYAVDDRVESVRLPLNPEAQAIVDGAIAVATERRDLVTEFYLLYSLLREQSGEAAKLLARYGGNASIIIAELERTL